MGLLIIASLKTGVLERSNTKTVDISRKTNIQYVVRCKVSNWSKVLPAHTAEALFYPSVLLTSICYMHLIIPETT